MTYRIIADASADIDAVFCQKYEIPILPMSYSIGDEMRECRQMEEDALLRKFYEQQKTGAVTRTTQITPFLYEELIEPYLRDGVSVLYLALSSGLSATVDSARQAAAALKEKYPAADFVVVDTLAATGGIGILAERGVRNQLKGLSLEENRDDLNEAVKRLHHWFLVDDLMYLKRGGRVSASTAIVGTVLSVKPILIIAPDGTLVTIDKARGTHAAVRKLLENYEKNCTGNPEDVVYICHAAADLTAEMLTAGIRRITPGVTIRRRLMSPIIGAHTGPGMASIIHLGKPAE